MVFENILLINPIVLAIIIIWSLVWKGIVLWKCGRQNQVTWFIIILIFNTVGILEIIYLLFFQKKEGKIKIVAKKKKKK